MGKDDLMEKLESFKMAKFYLERINLYERKDLDSRRCLFFLDIVWSWQVLYILVWYRLVWYGFVRNGIVGPEGSFKVLNSLEWSSKVYYSNLFPCKVSNGLIRFYMVFYGLTQLCTIFVLVFF